MAQYLSSLNQTKPNADPNRVYFAACILSLLFHIPLLFLPKAWLFSPSKTEKSPRRTIFLQRIRGSKSSALKRKKINYRRFRKRKSPIQQPPKKKPKKKQSDPKKMKGQVVDVPPDPTQKASKDSKYLSEHNTFAKKETVSRHQRLKYKISTRRLTQRKKSNPKQARLASIGMSSQRKTIAPPKRQTQKNKKRTKPVQPPKNPLELPKIRQKKKRILQKEKKGKFRNETRPQKMIPGRSKRFRFGIGQLKIDWKSISQQVPQPERSESSSSGSRQPNVVDLTPRLGDLSRIVGAPAPDKIDAPLGNETALNTRQWLYASFFNRVKQLIAQHWNPAKVYRRRDPYRNIYGTRNRTTTLSIELHPDGKLSNLKVLASSGLRFLDKEAVRSIRAAQPFPNPPRALISKGKIRFKFGFTLSLSQRAGFRLFR